MMMLMGGVLGGNQPRNNRDSRHSPPSSTRQDSSSPQLQPAILPAKRSASNTPINYPDLKEWLNALEENPTRNKHGEIFSQYGNPLVDTHKIYTIEDLTRLTTHDLATLGGMEFGVASRMICFAKDDVAMIHKKARRDY
jgi:hypothetical protein